MIVHVAAFSWKPGTTPEQIAAVQDALSALPSQIPSLRAYHFGADLGVAEGNADFAVVAMFDDVEGWREYAQHPAHLAVLADLVRPHLALRTAAQFTA